MSTKESLLTLLYENQGKYLSGEEIADKLCVSRTSVWKAIKSLKSSGYDIDAVTNKGYRLSDNTDILSISKLENYIDKRFSNLKLCLLESTASTNADLKIKAAQGAPEGLIYVANEQVAGRGRKGRDFYSPKGSGVYFSILLRPDGFDAKRTSLITTMAAVAVCEAIEKVSGKTSLIKWVNDIFVDNKKVCGILTEASFDLESGLCDYAILGIGINVYSPKGGFPKEIRDIAGSVFDNQISDGKSLLAMEVINHFLSYYYSTDPDSYKEPYKKRSLVLGRDILVISADKKEKATALDLDGDCHLIVKYEDGRVETLSSGEVSIKL